MDDFLIDSLLDEMLQGQKIGGSFTKSALVSVAYLIGEKFGLACHSDHIKNRMKTLKKKTIVLQKRSWIVVALDLTTKHKELRWLAACGRVMLMWETNIIKKLGFWILLAALYCMTLFGHVNTWKLL